MNKIDFNNCNPQKDIDGYLDKWNKNKEYTMPEDALKSIFLTKRENHLSSDDLLIKCSSLNDFYSTNIFKVYYVVIHYMNVKNLAERLDDGDTALVDDLRKVCVDIKEKDKIIGTKTMDYYCFATKFCSHHNPDKFPIYDSNVERVLKAFRKRDKKLRFRNEDLRDYRKFVDIIEQFKCIYHVESYGFKQIDQYLWQLGKELADDKK